MDNFNMKDISKTLDNMIALDATGDENMHDKTYEACKFSAEKIIEDWSISELDSFYEDGIGENDTFLSDVIFPVAIGYALITRYNISYDEYISWAKKQKTEMVYNLLKLIGIEQKRYKQDLVKKNLDNKIFKYQKMIDELESKYHVIEYSNDETGITLYGKNIKILPVAKNASKLLCGIEKAHEFAVSIFKNEFEKKCTNYKEASKNIMKVFNDAIEAEWVKCKRFLYNENVSDDNIELIYTRYLQDSNVTYLKQQLDSAYEELLNTLEGDAGEIVRDDINRKAVQFYGGGFGLKGSITGMISARIMSGIYDSITTGMTKGATERLKGRFEKTADNLYIGEEIQEVYYEILAAISDNLGSICLSVLFPYEIEDQTEIVKIIEEIDEDIFETVSGEQIRNLVKAMIFAYPCSLQTYNFAFKAIIGIRNELEEIANVFGIKGKINSWRSISMSESSDKLIYNDIQIYNQKKDELILDSLSYEGKYYRITIPISHKFIDNDFFECYMNGSLSRDGFLFNENMGIGIRFWGGIEGKDVFDKEVAKNTSQILEQVNSWENINIKDFSQKIEKIVSEDKFIQILHGELLYDKLYDVFMLTYADTEVYFNLCIGCPNSMGDRIDKIKSIINSVKIEQMKNKNKYSYCTYSDIKEILSEERKINAEKYFRENRDTLNLSFRIEFRKRFKALIKNSPYANNVIYKYDYADIEGHLYELMEKNRPQGQYIMYSSDSFVITDYAIWVKNSKKEFECINVTEILEILMVTTYFTEVALRLCVRKTDGNVKMIYISDAYIKEFSYLTTIINEAIDALVNMSKARYFKEINIQNQKEMVFCEKCKKISKVKIQESLLLRHVFCGNCNAESKFINRIVKEKAFKNIIADVDKKVSSLDIKDQNQDELNDIEKYEIQRFKQEENQQELTEMIQLVKKYIVLMDGQLDYNSAILYRVLFKWILNNYANKDHIVNEYDFRLPPEAMVSKSLMKTNQVGQYVIYNENGIVITDFHLYICANEKDYVYELTQLLEVLPMEEYYGGLFRGLVVCKKDNKVEFINDHSLKKIKGICDLINIVLEAVDIYKKQEPIHRYYNKYVDINNEPYIYCLSCNRWATIKNESGNVLNKFYCSNCHGMVLKALSRCKNEKLEIQINGLKAFLGEPQKICLDEEIKSDIQYGFLELGKKLFDEARKCKSTVSFSNESHEMETQNKKHVNPEHEANDWRYARFNENHVKKFRTQFLKAIDGSQLKKYVVDEDIKYISNPELYKLLNYMRQVCDEQIVLYYNNSVIVTDHYVVWGGVVKEIENIQEIVWFNLESNHMKSKIIFKTKYQNESYACKDEKQDKLITLIINVALTGIRDENFATEYDKESCYCEKCGSNDVVIKGMFKSKCKKCGNSYTGALYKNYWNGLNVEEYKAKVCDEHKIFHSVQSVNTQNEQKQSDVSNDNSNVFFASEVEHNGHRGILRLEKEKLVFMDSVTMREDSYEIEKIGKVNKMRTDIGFSYKGKILLIVFKTMLNTDKWEKVILAAKEGKYNLILENNLKQVQGNNKMQNVQKDETKRKMVYCTICGKQILAMSKFCTFCGTENKYKR